MESNPVHIEELLAHAGWVRKLAARLVRDAGTAEDVAQEVWAYALRSPPQERSNLRAWLSEAVRNTARSLHRAQSRRTEREAAVATRGEQPSAAELVERAQLHRELVEQVLALDEPHRSLVLAHWFESQSIVEIAKHRGLTPRVVKLRLDAALALLRQRMDKSSGGRSAWGLAFAKWIDPRALPVVTTGTGAALTLGGIVAASKFVVASVAVVLLAGLGWYFWPGVAPTIPLADERVGLDTQAVAAVPEPSELSPDGSTSVREVLPATEPKSASTLAAKEKRWLVRGRVIGAPAGRETETKLTAMFLGGYNVPDSAASHAAQDGSFEIDVTDVVATWLRNAEPSELQVVAAHPVCLRAEARAPFGSAQSVTDGAAFFCELTLVAAATVTGRVAVPPDWTPYQQRGRDAALPLVGLFEIASGLPQSALGLDYATCDELGRFALRANRSGTFSVVACSAGLRPTALVVDLVLGQLKDAGTIDLARAASISGTVWRAGRPIGAGARILADAKPRSDVHVSIPSPYWFPMELGMSEGSFEYSRVFTETRADGTYRLEGLAPAEYDIRVELPPSARMSMQARTRAERSVRAPQSGVDLEGVPPRIELTLTVDGRTPNEAELEGVVVDLVAMPNESSKSDIDLTRSTRGYGGVALDVGVSYELRVRPGRYVPTVMRLGPFEQGFEQTLNLDLKPQDHASTLVVRVVTETPEILTGAKFAFLNPASVDSEPVDWISVARSNEGTFVLRDRSPGTYHVRVRPFQYWANGSPSKYLETSFDIVIPPKTTVVHELPLVLGGLVRMSAKDVHGGYVRAAVELRDQHDGKIPTDFYFQVGGTMHGCGWYLCEQGLNDHPPLPAGKYEFNLSAEGFANEVRNVEIVAGETQTIEIVLHAR